MDESKPPTTGSRVLATVFTIYLGLILLGWGCLLVNEDSTLQHFARVALLMLAISAGLALVIGIPWAFILHSMKKRNEPIPSRRTTLQLFTMVSLLPFLSVAGVVLLFLVPFWIVDWAKPEAAKTVKTAPSPEGEWIAYVVGKPALDGPNWQLYLKRAGEQKGRRVARLMGDVDRNQEIDWSPRGDVVVFLNSLSLFAIRPADLKSAAATLGARRVPADHGMFSPLNIDSRARAEVSNIRFPADGSVEYTATLKGKREVKRMPAEAFQKRKEGWAVSPFEGEPGGTFHL